MQLLGLLPLALGIFYIRRAFYFRNRPDPISEQAMADTPLTPEMAGPIRFAAGAILIMVGLLMIWPKYVGWGIRMLLITVGAIMTAAPLFYISLPQSVKDRVPLITSEDVPYMKASVVIGAVIFMLSVYW